MECKQNRIEWNRKGIHKKGNTTEGAQNRMEWNITQQNRTGQKAT